MILFENVIKKKFLKLFKDFNNDKVIQIKSNKNDYNKSFGYQWNIFKKTQLDSFTKLSLSYNRFKCTNWDIKELENKNLLEVGSGAGRFTELFLKTKCYLFTFDSSDAIFANFENNKININDQSFFIKNSLENDIFLDNCFDYIFCYGVIQHTKNPFDSLSYLIKKLKKNGKLSVDFYRKRYIPYAWSLPKYLWRPITRRIDKKLLLGIIKFYIPKYLKLDTFIKKKFGSKLGNLICGIIPIPCWNYYFLDINDKLKEEWAILDTFDALSATYDYPLKIHQIEKFIKKIENIEYQLFYGSNGIVLNILKK